MAATLTRVSAIAYSGSIDELPAEASPGLRFLRAWISRVDSLSNDDSLESLLSPNATLIHNAEPPKLAHAMTDSQQRKRVKRNTALKSIRRDFQCAWDIDNGDDTRTVIYESRNFFFFAADPENPVIMPEASTITLKQVPETESARGIDGLWAIEFRSWHDRVDMLKKREQLGC